MWNLKASSKITQDKMRQKSYEIHRQKLYQMKPKMNIEKPCQPWFVYSKNKLNLSRKQRRIEIDRHNEILLRKMNKIKVEQYNTNKLRPQAQNLKTLNAHVMNTMNDQITNDNKKLCQKLLKTQSFYRTNNIMEKTNELQRICGNISENARRAMSAKSLTRPKSGITTTLSRRERSPDSHRYLSKFQDKRSSQFGSSRPETAPFHSSKKPRTLKPQVQQQLF